MNSQVIPWPEEGTIAALVRYLLTLPPGYKLDLPEWHGTPLIWMEIDDKNEFLSFVAHDNNG